MEAALVGKDRGRDSRGRVRDRADLLPKLSCGIPYHKKLVCLMQDGGL